MEENEIFFESVDSIILGKDILVTTNNDIIGRTNDKEIQIGFKKIREMMKGKSDVEILSTIKGINYHEVGHILFGYPIGTKDLSDSVDKHFAELINLLEDQRVDSLFSQLYNKTKSYFSIAYLNLIKIDENVFPLIYGRRLFIDKDIMNTSEEVYKKKHNILEDDMNKIKQYIDGYITEKVKEQRIIIGYKLYDIFKKYLYKKDINSKTINENIFPKGNGQLKEDEVKGKYKDIDELVNDLAEALNNMDENDEIQLPEKNDNDNGLPDRDINDLIHNIESDVKSNIGNSLKKINDEIMEDMRSIKAIKDSEGLKITNDDTTMDDIEKSNMNDSIFESFSVIKFRKIFENIKDKSEYRYNMMQKSGRLDIRRAMKTQYSDDDRIFKKWQIGNDDKFLCGIMVDVSGSTCNYHMDFIRASHAFSKAVEGIGESFVVAFANKNFTAKRMNNRAVKRIPIHKLGGGTDPSKSLLESIKMIRSKRIKTKLLFMFTDMQFGLSDIDFQTYMDSLRFSNVKVFIIMDSDYIPYKWLSSYKNVHIVKVDNYKEDTVFNTLKKVVEKEVVRKMV